MTAPIEPMEKKPSVPFALLLAFIPSPCVLAAFGVFASESNAEFVNPWLPWAAIFLAVVCVCCCFISSFILFRRKTVLTILIGVLFLLINGMISLFFGCVAVLSTSSILK